MSDVQSDNAQNPRGVRRDQGVANPNNGQGGQHRVHGDPAAGTGFTFERASKIQCIQGVQYCVAPDSLESLYFIQHATEALRAGADLPAPAPVSPLLWAIADALAKTSDPSEVITIRQIQHGQLKYTSNPDISQREPPANDIAYLPMEWQNYLGKDANGKTIYMAQAPASEGGKHYEVANQRSFDFNVRILGEVTLGLDFVKDKTGVDAAAGEIDYAFLLRLGRRGPNHVYSSAMKKEEVIISVSVGEINASTGGFVAWSIGGVGTDLVCVRHASLQNRLFSQFNSKGPHWPVWDGPRRQEEEEEEEEDVMAVLHRDGARQRFNLIAKDQVMCFSHTEKGTKEPEMIAVCNFVLMSLTGLFQFVEDDAGEPYFKIVCQSMVDENADGGDVYLAADDVVRTPRLAGRRSLLVEVLVQPGSLKSTADVSKLFQKYHVRLLPSIMTPDMLRCWMAEQPSPPVTRCIVRFGRQSGGEFVLGNVVFTGPYIMELDTARIAVVPQFFKDSILPIPKQDYPRITIIPQTHVRYVIGVNLWQNLMPQFFCNNTIAARAVFALGVMGLFASKIWAGESGLGHGMPFGWIYSPEPNTGKTEALLILNSMLGLFHRAPWSGDATRSALFERFNQQADMTVAVDDVVVNPNAPESRVFMQMGRALYDRIARAVTGKIRCPHSSALFTVRS